MESLENHAQAQHVCVLLTEGGKRLRSGEEFIDLLKIRPRPGYSHLCRLRRIKIFLKGATGRIEQEREKLPRDLLPAGDGRHACEQWLVGN